MPAVQPLNGSPRLQALTFIALIALFTPLLSFIAIASRLVSPYRRVTKHIAHQRKWRAISSSTFRPRTILITGVSTLQGLSLARAFYRAGHNVVGADFDHFVPSRFSTSLNIFYRVAKPTRGARGNKAYMRDVLDICKKEKVELWVPCSEIPTTTEDGDCKIVIEKLTRCKVLLFGSSIIEVLDDSVAFAQGVKSIGLNAPETHLIVSEKDALAVLYPESSVTNRNFLLKTLNGNAVREKTLPLATEIETEAAICASAPSPRDPLVLQEQILGPLFSTHSLSIRGTIKAFAAVPTSSNGQQTPNRALPPTSALHNALLSYVQAYAKGMGAFFTGHLSITFVLAASTQTTSSSKSEILPKLYPISHSPRASISSLSLEERSEDLAEAYLSILSSHEPKGVVTGHYDPREVVVPPSITPGFYSIGPDFVTLVFLPLLSFLMFTATLKDVLEKWALFFEHVTFDREILFMIWDPWVVWWMYCVCLPIRLWGCIWTKRDWRLIVHELGLSS